MATIHVSGGGSALANAIAAASTGDVLVVSDGLYSPYAGNGKSIVVESQNGPENCIVDGGCVWQDNEVGGTIVTQGTRCISNYGGIRIVFRGLTLQNGGTFENDGLNASGYGGGAYGGEFQHCVFRRNFCWKEGGGCAVSNTFRCEFIENVTLLAGHATRDGTHTFDYFHDNGRLDTGTYGGTCYIGHYFGCLVAHNKTLANSAGMADGFCVNCTITSNNSATGRNGYGARMTNGPYSSMHNCIVHGNSTAAANPVSEFMAAASSGFPVANNCLPQLSNIGSTIDAHDNVIADPLFADASTSDFHLLKDSPCIGIGDPQQLSNPVDMDGTPWRIPPSVGCYESAWRNFLIPTRIIPMGASL